MECYRISSEGGQEAVSPAAAPRPAAGGPVSGRTPGAGPEPAGGIGAGDTGPWGNGRGGGSGHPETLWMRSRLVVPNLFDTWDWFCGRQFFHGLEVGGMVLGQFKRMTFL